MWDVQDTGDMRCLCDKGSDRKEFGAAVVIA